MKGVVTTENVDKYRDRIKIGDTVYLETSETVGALHKRMYRVKRRKAKVVYKSRHILLVQDEAGKVLSTTYRELLILKEDRKRHEQRAKESR